MFTNVTAPCYESREAPRVVASRGFRADKMAVSSEKLPPGVDASSPEQRSRLREHRALPESAHADSRAANDRVRRGRVGRRGGEEGRRLPGGRARDGFDIGENRRRKLGCRHPGRRVSDNASDARESLPHRSANR